MSELRTETTFCRICEALCGLEVDLDGDQVVALRPDPAHVATGGYSCVKGLRQAEYLSSPDRLRYPLVRRNGELMRATWDQALERIGSVVRRERAIHPDRVAMYVGTAAGFGVLHPIFAQGFMTGVGSKSMYASATQDCSNKFAAATDVYGFPFTQPFPDVDHTECLIVVGANPAISKWSFLQVSNPIDRLRQIERRGASLFFVDPRKTESAKVAGEHVFIRPGTDVFFYLAFLHEILERDAVDHARVRAHGTGFERLAEVVRGWTPERAAEVTRMAPATLRRLVDAYVAADGAALYSSTGVNMGGHGALCFWLQETINFVTGNLDRRGGTLVGEGIIDFPAFGKKTGTLLGKHRSRVGDFQATNDALPGGVLADEILTPGEKQVRALFVTGGNPLLTMANSGRLAKAFRELELLVCLDVFPSETAHLADVVLPCVSPLQRPDLPFVFPLMLGLQSRPYLQATRALIPPEGEQRDEATIYLDICRASGVDLFGSKVAQRALGALRRGHELRGGAGVPEELLLDLLLRACRQPGFEKVLAQPHGMGRKPHRPESFLGQRVVTDDGKVPLAPERMVAEAARTLETTFAREKKDAKRLKLITKRHVTTHNSWMHDHEAFVRKGTNHLYLHPTDAERLGIAGGAMADVTSETATVRLPVLLSPDLMEGTCALPHGWGHQHARKLRVASQTRGVNVNLLAADGPDALERVGGMARLTGIPVDVKPAAGPQAHTWSGLPQDTMG